MVHLCWPFFQTFTLQSAQAVKNHKHREKKIGCSFRVIRCNEKCSGLCAAGVLQVSSAITSLKVQWRMNETRRLDSISHDPSHQLLSVLRFAVLQAPAYPHGYYFCIAVVVLLNKRVVLRKRVTKQKLIKV